MPGRDLLLTGHREEPGYGLYGHILLPTPETGNRGLFAAVMNAYLKTQEVDRFEPAEIARREWNFKYLPIRKSPSTHPAPGWLLVHCDFLHALIVARSAQIPLPHGPCIISYAVPLTQTAEVDPIRIMAQALSGVPADLA